MANKDWWFGESSLWGELTGKKARGEAKRARERTRKELKTGLSEAELAISGVGEYKPLDLRAQDYQVPEALRRRMGQIRQRTGELTREGVQRTAGSLARRGISSSGIGQSLLADIRRRAGRGLSEQLTGLDLMDQARAQQMFEKERAFQQAENLRAYKSKLAKAKLLADIYKTRAGALAGIEAEPLPPERSDLGALLDIGSSILPVL